MRLRPVTTCRRFMAKPCTPHPITRMGYATSVRQQSCQRLCNPQAAQLSLSSNPAMSGGEGPSPRLSLGDPKGVFSSEREYPLWCRSAHAAPPPAQARKKRNSPLRAAPSSSPRCGDKRRQCFRRCQSRPPAGDKKAPLSRCLFPHSAARFFTYSQSTRSKSFASMGFERW